MNDSTKRYIELVANMDVYANNIHISKEDQDKFTTRTASSRRIVVTGTGTSLPTAQYLATRLQGNFPMKPVHFLPTARAIRAAEQLTKDDLLILISYGLNRADALITLDKAARACQTITISGNPSFELSENLNIIVPPREERIFCRPVSPLTTLQVIERLCGGVSYLDAPIKGLGVAKDMADWIQPAKQTIILYASDVSFAAELWGITLREGAGMNVSIKDMENYSHGYYGPDTSHLNERQYVILKSDSEEDERDFNRAKGLYSVKDLAKYVVTSHGDVYQANANLFREVPELIALLLRATDYNMYGPIGMDENRRYHEYDHFKNY